MAAKEKTNLLEVIPCRSEHITAEREGETIVLSFPRFKYSWMQRFLVPKGMSKEHRIYLEEHVSLRPIIGGNYWRHTVLSHLDRITLLRLTLLFQI